MKDDVKVESSGGIEIGVIIEVLVFMLDKKIQVSNLFCIFLFK